MMLEKSKSNHKNKMRARARAAVMIMAAPDDFAEGLSSGSDSWCAKLLKDCRLLHVLYWLLALDVLDRTLSAACLNSIMRHRTSKQERRKKEEERRERRRNKTTMSCLGFPFLEGIKLWCRLPVGLCWLQARLEESEQSKNKTAATNDVRWWWLFWFGFGLAGSPLPLSVSSTSVSIRKRRHTLHRKRTTGAIL